jgi:hypothetical protein
MFVTNHVLSGALIGQLVPDAPLAAFAVGVGSHLVLDAVPHWGCPPRREGEPDLFLRAAVRDGLVGAAVMAVVGLSVDRRRRPASVAAMLGAVLLDLDKPLGYFFGVNPFPEIVNRVHGMVQSESPEGMKNEIAAGAVLASANWLLVVRRPNPHALRVAHYRGGGLQRIASLFTHR